MNTAERNQMPARDAAVRAHDFSEVAQGFSAQTAVAEAERCLQCKNPLCVKGCPVGVEIPRFIGALAKGDFAAAWDSLSQKNVLPAVCGRVCPQENQCEGKCVRGIKSQPVAIGGLERFVADWHASQPAQTARPQANGQKVAVIGSGPAGLSCAGVLAKKGYAVTVFEALHLAGGVLSYGIPEFRLPKAIVAREVDALEALGVTVRTDFVVGKTATLDELRAEFDAVFIGTGAGLPRFLNIPGEGLCGVFSANEFLTRANLMKGYLPDAATPIYVGKAVTVVGGGNVAMDAARTALRLGAESVTVVYRRTAAELPARAEEVEHAKEEGIRFLWLHNPVELLGETEGAHKGFVRAMVCEQMKLTEPDERGRCGVEPIENSRVTVETDCVIMAVGTAPNPLLRASANGLEFTARGGIVTNETGATSLPAVFAGGDAVTGAATVISAMGAGKTAAEQIDRELSEKRKK